MNGRRSSRRSFLGTLLGGVALLAAGRINGALADKNLTHGTKENFQTSCEQYEGVFIDSPKDKLTACFYPDGSKTVCDANGQDCENYPPPKPTKVIGGGVEDPFGGFGGVATTEITEAVETTPADGATPAPVEITAALNNNSGKRRARRGKRRKK